MGCVLCVADTTLALGVFSTTLPGPDALRSLHVSLKLAVLGAKFHITRRCPALAYFALKLDVLSRVILAFLSDRYRSQQEVQDMFKQPSAR